LELQDNQARITFTGKTFLTFIPQTDCRNFPVFYTLSI